MNKAFAFAFKMIGDVTASMLGPLTVIGDRLQLFDALADGGPAASDGFAARTGITERYAREWLSAMACHGYVSYDDGARRFGLQPEHAFCLFYELRV